MVRERSRQSFSEIRALLFKCRQLEGEGKSKANKENSSVFYLIQNHQHALADEDDCNEAHLTILSSARQQKANKSPAAVVQPVSLAPEQIVF